MLSPGQLDVILAQCYTLITPICTNAQYTLLQQHIRHQHIYTYLRHNFCLPSDLMLDNVECMNFGVTTVAVNNLRQVTTSYCYKTKGLLFQKNVSYFFHQSARPNHFKPATNFFF